MRVAFEEGPAILGDTIDNVGSLAHGPASRGLALVQLAAQELALTVEVLAYASDML